MGSLSNFFIPICKVIAPFWNLSIKYTPPLWFTADKAYRRRSRRQHVQPTWPTAVRPPPTVDSMVWVARHLTAMPNATVEQW
jgi:hypothetical protein